MTQMEPHLCQKVHDMAFEAEVRSWWRVAYTGNFKNSDNPIKDEDRGFKTPLDHGGA